MFEKLEKRTCLSGFGKPKNNFDLDFSTQAYFFQFENQTVVAKFVELINECDGPFKSSRPTIIYIGELK
jgi:hypothetical protein